MGKHPACRGVRCEKVLSAQTEVAREDPPAWVRERFGGQGRRLMGAVGLAKQRMANAGLGQVIRSREKAAFGSNAAEDKVRVRRPRREHRPAGLHGRMDGLNGHLRGGQVPANQDVQVQLREFRFHTDILEGEPSEASLTCGSAAFLPLCTSSPPGTSPEISSNSEQIRAAAGA
jgi:hypothetical protein